ALLDSVTLILDRAHVGGDQGSGDALLLALNVVPRGRRPLLWPMGRLAPSGAEKQRRESWRSDCLDEGRRPWRVIVPRTPSHHPTPLPQASCAAHQSFAVKAMNICRPNMS